MRRSNRIDRFLVTAAQMQAIEQSVFAAGMSVPALMEKVGGLLFDNIRDRFPKSNYAKVGVLVGPGHNGGDALVVGRELWLAGYSVKVWMPGERSKPLTAEHARYLRWLGAEWVNGCDELQDCQLLIDGLFGFGLERELQGIWAETVRWANDSGIEIASIDLPSGIHSDSGKRLGTAIRATITYCLGLWKQGLLQDSALEFVGIPQQVDFGLPLAAITEVLGEPPALERITPEWIRVHLPPQRWGTELHPPNPNTHKYTHGHLLLVCGSMRYSGAAILTALGTRPTGVGMVTLAVPEGIQMLVRQWIPEALVLACPQTPSGSIASIPGLSDSKYSAISFGPGMDRDIDGILSDICAMDLPVLLDADGLNALARSSLHPLESRRFPTLLTPHVGEFRRLFPAIPQACRFEAVLTAAQQCGASVLLKGARTAISNGARTWVNPESTPALARGGSGDVLTGLIGGLMAQAIPVEDAAGIASWWHARAAIDLAQASSIGSVDPVRLAQQCQQTPAFVRLPKL